MASFYAKYLASEAARAMWESFGVRSDSNDLHPISAFQLRNRDLAYDIGLPNVQVAK